MPDSNTEQSSIIFIDMENQSRFTEHLRKARSVKKREGKKAKQLTAENRVNLVNKRECRKSSY